MRYPASEKLEIIRLVEQSHLPVRRTLEKLGIRPSTFYRWYDRYQSRRARSAGRQAVHGPIASGTASPTMCASGSSQLALDEPELSPRELAARFTDTESYFVSEASVYRLLKAHDLITSPAFIVMKAADEFKDKTTAPNQLWQTDFTYLKVIGWGWFYLSTILDDFSRYIIAWKLCTTMKAEDVTDTLELALTASGLRSARGRAQAAAAQRQRLELRLRRPGRMARRRTAWSTSAARPIIRRPRARSSAGIRRSRTASCSRTTTCPAISKPRSTTSSITTITGATTRACSNLTPADVYFGRGQTILLERERIKRETIKQPTLAASAAKPPNLNQQIEPEPPFTNSLKLSQSI